jgi:hypothetical protein
MGANFSRREVNIITKSSAQKLFPGLSFQYLLKGVQVFIEKRSDISQFGREEVLNNIINISQLSLIGVRRLQKNFIN